MVADEFDQVSMDEWFEENLLDARLVGGFHDAGITATDEEGKRDRVWKRLDLFEYANTTGIRQVGFTDHALHSDPTLQLPQERAAGGEGLYMVAIQVEQRA